MGAQGGPRATEEPLGEYAGFGGRALTSAVVSKEVAPLSHALGPENKLVIAPGMLSGTIASISGRLSVGCKSPLTGALTEANSGGQGARALARLGYAAIILEGKPQNDDLYKVFISAHGVKISVENSLRMLPNFDLVERMKQQHGDKIACISIGPAGEMKMSAASIAVTDSKLRPTRHAGRGGVGAVMGAKGVKVIVLDDTGMKERTPKNPEKFKEARRNWGEALKKHRVADLLPLYGKSVSTDVSRVPGTLSTEGCHQGCDSQCSGVNNDNAGHRVSKRPKYETVWAHDGQCGISDPEAIAQLDFLGDNYGLDTIEMGGTLWMAMEGGLLKFGDGQGAIDMLHQIGQGTLLGRILGNGAEVTGKILGVGKAPLVKRKASPAGNPLKPGHRMDRPQDLQIATAAIDATGICIFKAHAVLDQPDTIQLLLDLINSFHGLSLDGDGLVELGATILEMERDFNARAGYTAEHDRRP